MPKTKITDDDVLHVLNEAGLDAEDITAFRMARHLLSHGVPACCVYYHMALDTEVPSPSAELINELMADSGLLGAYANCTLASFAHANRARILAKKAHVNLRYVPCPACVLTRKFVRLPKGCGCCLDRKKHPGTDCDPPPDDTTEKASTE
jgi:hypothetical protein